MEGKDNYISPEEVVDVIEELGGKFPGYRRAHAKGIGFDAEFIPNGNAAAYTTASHLQNDSIRAVVRFSHSSPSPDPTEWLVPIKGMAVRFLLPDGGFTNLTMANVPVFITKTPEAFVRLMKLMTAGTMSLREKWRILRKDPEFRKLPALLKALKTPASFATETYNALHSYYLVNETGDRQAVRFSWIPVLHEEQAKTALNSRSNLEAELLARMKSLDVQFRLMIQLAEEGDPIDDPSVMWPVDRKMVEAGILTLKSVREDAAESFVFDPALEVEGLECSDDPILKYRSPVYAESSSRRFREDRLPGQ